MRIDHILEEQRPVFSFEFFPPKTDEGQRTLEGTLAELKDDRPEYVSVTYGAGGTTRDRTVEITKWIKQDLGIEAMAHLSCVGESKERLDEILGELQAAGIENVLALRGDPPRGETEWTPHPGGLHYSTELIQLIRERLRLLRRRRVLPRGAPGGARPRRPTCASPRRRSRPAPSFLITQLFFDNELYFDFVEQARAAGIDVPIIPGIMPITNLKPDQDDHRACAAPRSRPSSSASSTRAPATRKRLRELGVAYATLQCSDLLARGAPGIHFYTLNRSPATRAILAALRAAQPWARGAASSAPAVGEPVVAHRRRTGPCGQSPARGSALDGAASPRSSRWRR